jgi:CDGSH-type Zn-finger protein
MDTNTNAGRPRILCLPNGPYCLAGDSPAELVKHLQGPAGESYTHTTCTSLCRCGGSANKPFCDGTHGRNGFTDAKAADRKLDRRDTYVGAKITIHDNRGICSSAGFCGGGLPAVFNGKRTPTVSPDAAPVAAIIEIIRKCPSGALSYTIDGVEHRDQDRPPAIVVSKDGPYEVTGGCELVDQSFGDGASLEHYTLCRCGESKNKPFCDGQHKRSGFKDE